MTKNNSAETEKKLRCPVCGYRFNQKEANQCQVCPLQKRCRLIMCPRCSHEFTDVNC